MTFVKNFCYCVCHDVSRIGDANELRHKGLAASAYVLEVEALEHPRGVSVHDHIACVFACDRCRKFHAAVLKPQPPAPLGDYDPPKEPPPPASACGDDE